MLIIVKAEVWQNVLFENVAQRLQDWRPNATETGQSYTIVTKMVQKVAQMIERIAQNWPNDREKELPKIVQMIERTFQKLPKWKKNTPNVANLLLNSLKVPQWLQKWFKMCPIVAIKAQKLPNCYEKGSKVAQLLQEPF